MAGEDLSAQSLAPNARFNWVFLVELLVCGLVTLFFLFYFNRVFSKALSLLVRLYLRWKGLPHYVDIQSLQISLLAGRIFFGRVTYHGVNETISIVSGHITWRYWLRRVRHASVGITEDGRGGGVEGGGGDTKADEIPCRVLVDLKGVEWFVYNRSPAYDTIIEQMASESQPKEGAGDGHDAGEGRKETGYSGHSGVGDASMSKAETFSTRIKTSIGSLLRDYEGSIGGDSRAGACEGQDTPFLRMLPIKVHVNRGAVVMGNNNTPSILVAHFEGADATIDAARSIATVDKYKQVYSVDFTHPVIQFKTNMEYKEPLISRGSRLLSSEENTNLNQKSHHPRRNRRQKLKDLLPLFSESIESLAPSETAQNGDLPMQQRVTGQDRWIGLSRYLDEGLDEGWKFEPAEYAKVSTVLDCPRGKMSFYWDVPGPVIPPQTASTIRTAATAAAREDDINGSQHPPPEWGIDLSFEGGTIHYGPWTDRQRVHLQNMFFPRLYKTATPATNLEVGQDRVPTVFKLFIEFSSSTILRIPTREESKDHKYRRRLNDGEVRPFGWLEIKVAAESTISYEMAMVASRTGWKNGLNVDLKNPEVRSSVNHGLLWKAAQQTIRCNLSGPLQWNGKHRWSFDVLSRGIEIFILREHVTLMTDLVTDWATGPLSEYWCFTPFLYDIGLRFEDGFEVCLNVNDQNIINNPSDVEDNTFLVLRGDGGLRANVGLDMTRYRPDESTVRFEVWTEDGDKNRLQLGVRQPVWNTWHSFLNPEIGMKLGIVNEFKLKGCYNYYATSGVGLIDTLLMDIEGRGLKLQLLGFLIRYFLVIRENYFGENLHFKTLEEWQKQGDREAGVPVVEGNNKKANDLDVILNVDVKDSCVIMPKHLYSGTGQNLKLDVAALGLDMRFTNYYMDLQVNFSPISASLTSTPNNPQVFIDGLTIYGHRLFGLPPTEPTYVCNWDITLGTITGECTPEFLPTSICALQAFVFSFEDKENALPVPHSDALIIHDVTFVKVSVKAIKLWLRVDGPSAIRITSGEILFILNDLADEKHSERISLSMPDMTIACVDVDFGSRELVQTMETSGYLGTSLKMTVFGRKKDFSKHRRLQMKHVRESDFRTGRARFLIREDFEAGGSRVSSMYNENLDPDPPSLPLPGLPEPLYGLGEDGYREFRRSSIGYASSRHTGSTGKKSSFLASSSASSIAPSILRAASSHAPSFHSAVETMTSDTPMVTPAESRRAPLSPTSTTPGSQSPRRSTRARSRRESSDGQQFGAGKARSKVLLSSSFMKPQFPLDAVEPDLRNVPELSLREDGQGNDDMEGSWAPTGNFVDESTAQTSIVVEFVSGIRGYCTAVAVDTAVQLLESLQPKSPEDILDSIQIGVVDKLAKLMANTSQDSNIMEICLKLPQFKFRFKNPIPRALTHSIYSIDDEKPDEDAYNLELGNLIVAARSKKIYPNPQNSHEERLPAKEILSVHLLLGALEVTLSQLQAGYQDPLSKPALGVLIEDLLFWASTNESSTASLQVETIASSLQSCKALFLYDAADRTEALVRELQHTFEALSNNKKKRIQALAYGLAVAGEQFNITGDPSSLTRPSYVLRSSLDHVRVNDSWKVMSRMRHIYESLSAGPRENIQLRCIANVGGCPADGRRQVVSAFERWRSWELANLHNSYIVEALFGIERRTDGPLGAASLMKAQIMVVGVRLLVDPGPSQDEFTIDNILAKVSMGNPEVVGSSVVSTVGGPSMSVSTIVQVHCRTIQLGLTWEILDILEGFSKVFVERQNSGSRTTSESASVKSVKPGRKQSFHVLWTTDTGSITLDTVNLKSISKSHNIQASLFISDKNSELQEALLGSVLLRADLVTSELKYGNKTLSMTKLQKPSLYGHFDEHCFAETRFNIWKISGSCEDLSFDVREEVLGLMEVIDFVVNDEVSQIWRLVEEMKESLPQASSSPALPLFPRRNVHVLHLTLSLDSFVLEATLLPALAYVVRGNGVRASARPKHLAEEMIIDFDVLHHEHEIRTGYDKEQTRSISILQLPAINGRVRHRDSAEEQLVEVFVSLEAIKLDASSIQSLLNALTKPEVENVIENARAEWIGTQARLDEIFDTSNKPPAPSVKTGTPLIYRAHVGVAGVKIQSSAPSANLDIDLGCIQVHASNKPKADSPILSLPEVHVEFREITIELNKVTIEGSHESCGYVELHASILCSSKETSRGRFVRAFYIKSHSLQIDLFAETASTIVDVAGHLQDKLRDLDLSREVKYLRKLRSSKPLVPIESVDSEKGANSMALFSSVISVEMMGIQISWITGSSTPLISPNHPRQNLVLSFKRIDFATATRKENEARLTIEELLLQMVDVGSKHTGRSENSATMPEVIFNVAYFLNGSDRRLAFQAKGTSLDLRLTSSCVVGVNQLETSIATASEKFRDASATWKSMPTENGAERENMFGTKRLRSVLVDADFAGAVVHFSKISETIALAGLSSRAETGASQGRYGQFAHGESSGTTILRSPGLAFKAEYVAPIDDDPSLNAEVKISASSNTLYPSVVPLILEMSSNIKEIMREPTETKAPKPHKHSTDAKESSPNPAAILGKCRLNIGLRICKQEFTLSCQPIARVAASAGYEEIYVTVSTCEEAVDGRFYAISATAVGLQASLKHVYSRDSTGHLEVQQLVVSLMNSKHLNGSDGLSCIMKLSPIKSQLNIKQFQDFLLFREIWLPEEIRQNTPTPAVQSSEPSAMLVQRYHKVAATKAFPWNTAVTISEIDLQLDLGQSLGKSSLLISNLWLDSRKSSDWEQTMSLGFDAIKVTSVGRLSGFIHLKNMKVRTSIHWLSGADEVVQTPLIQASLSFEQLQVKTLFDYQAFLLADITSFHFLMYNLQKVDEKAGDRLVGVLDGDKIQIYCTTLSASQALALYQTFIRLKQEKLSAYEASLKDVERYLNRRSQSFNNSFPAPAETLSVEIHRETPPPPTFLSLYTDVVVTLKEVSIGVFPSSFYDTQVFKLEALNALARFGVGMEVDKLHSKLEMKLGELRVALATIKRPEMGTSLGDVSVEDIVHHARGARGGTILKVPEVTAFMHTWHKAGSTEIEYIFKSAFKGKVDVGWNYSRVSFIKGMWANHVKEMAQRQGKTVTNPHITISTGSVAPSEVADDDQPENQKDKGQHKITAVVNVPQSRYEYTALEPPVIETPQLRDMGEATPPLEWIGLHRDRLPNLTHQIVIVSLLEIAREVEDAYSKILGTS